MPEDCCDWLSNIMDNASDAIIIVDRHQRVISFNRSAGVIFGCTAEEAVGLLLDAFVPELSQATRHEHLSSFRNLESDVSRSPAAWREVSALRKDGRIFPAEVAVSQIRSGGEAACSIFLRDITERRRLEDALRESEARLEDFVCAASGFFWEMDENLRFSFISPGFAEISGIPVETLLGKTCGESGFGQSADPETWRRHQDDIAAHRPFQNVEQFHPKPGGEIVYLTFTGKPLFDEEGRFRGYRGSGTDATARVTAERKAQAAQDQLAEAIETLSEGFILYDADDRIVVCNQKYREIFAPLSEMLAPGVHVADWSRAYAYSGMVPAAVGREEEWLAERMAAHRNPAGPRESQLANGRYLRIMEYKTASGGRAGLRMDITESRRVEAALRETEALLRSFIDNAPAMIVLRDMEGRNLLVNEAFSRARGLAPDDLQGTIGHGASTRDHAGKAQRHHQQVYEQGITITEERDTLLPNGKRYQSLVTKFPVFNSEGVITQIGSIGTDISKLKETERQLELARESAEFSNRAKSEFLANMSHELRTPLNAIIGFSNALETGIYGPVPALQQERIRDIGLAGGHLLEVINDILDLSKVEAGAFEPHIEEVGLESIVESALRLMGPRAHDAGICLRAEIPDDMPKMRADERMLKQILINLLSNAVKFTPAGGDVVVAIPPPEGAGVRIEVRDTGIGMDPRHLPKALATFGQVEGAMTRGHRGTGLGLPLVKAFMELHHGTLEIDSALGEGTVVRLLFPTARRSAGDRDGDRMGQFVEAR